MRVDPLHRDVARVHTPASDRRRLAAHAARFAALMIEDRENRDNWFRSEAEVWPPVSIAPHEEPADLPAQVSRQLMIKA